MLVKREKKRILKKEMPDSDVKKYYRNYNPQNAWIFFFFAFTTYFPLKKAYEQIRTLYREEAAERKIELNLAVVSVIIIFRAVFIGDRDL